jgi:hypothetical protein
MKKKSLRTTGMALVAATLVVGIGSVSMAAVQTNGSDGPLHIYDGGSVTLVSPATSMSWSGDLLASSSSTDAAAAITCPTASTGYRTFISARGSERTPANWSAFKSGSFADSTKTIAYESLTPTSLINGTPGQAAVKASGGDFSLGIACTSNSGVTVNEAFYRYVTVTAGTGAFVAAATADVASPEPTPTADPTMTGTIALSATTTAAQDGTLSLSVPANAAATFGSPSLVNNKSTTTGTLPNVTVTDERIVSRQGWSISANVADFVNSSNNAITIGKTNLGIAPSIVTNAGGVTAGAATTAGSATYPATFAEASVSNGVGTSVIGGNLTFVAPQDKAAGTYTSTLTLTLVSK